jgi:hypothetical protein
MGKKPFEASLKSGRAGLPWATDDLAGEDESHGL